MKFYAFGFILLLFSCKAPVKENAVTDQKPRSGYKQKPRSGYDQGVMDTVILGDINNDRIIDTGFVYTPPTLYEYDKNGELLSWFGCKDDKCFNRVTFSCNLPDLIVDNTVLGEVAAVDDVDGDGYKELLFNRNWFIGTITGLYLYHFNGKDWENIEHVSIRGGLYEEEEPTPVSNYQVRKVT